MTYIDPRGKVFAHLDRLAAWRRGEKPFPVTVEIDLSNRCALGCQSCHFAYTHTRGPWASRTRLLPLYQDRGGDLINLGMLTAALHEMRRGGVKAVVWSGGGEPTTHPQWEDAVAIAHEAGLEQGMYTFGGLLDERSARHLAARAKWVVVSLDCVDATTYAHEKGVPEQKFWQACNGIRALAQARAAVIGVSFLLHANNWGSMLNMLNLARSLGATYTTFRPTIESNPGNPRELLGDRSWVTVALPILEHFAGYADVELDVSRFLAWRDWQQHPYATCQGIRLTTTITPDGRVWLCPNRREFHGSCLGNLHEESFAEIWARHPGEWTDFAQCRAMCRLNTVNEQLAAITAPRKHGSFI